jgi:hypothetical protein
MEASATAIEELEEKLIQWADGQRKKKRGGEA